MSVLLQRGSLRRLQVALGRALMGLAVLAACLVWAASAQAQPFVYVAGQSGAVSQFSAIGGPLVPLTPPLVESGPPASTPTGVVVSPDGKSVYVTNQFADSVSQYNVGADGTLSPKTPATVASGHPIEVAVSADGKSVYVTNLGTPGMPGTVSQYDVGAGGVLTPKTPATVAAGVVPVGIAVSADGHSLYVANEDSATVSQYDVGAGGVLTPKTPAMVGTGTGSFGVVISPDGKSVYVSGLGPMAQFDVGPGGALTPKAPSMLAGGEGIAITPDGKSVYTVEPDFNAVVQYDVGLGGALAPKSPPSVATGNVPLDVAVSPDGKSVYVTNSFEDSVSQYSVGAGGGLTPMTPAMVSTDSRPGFNSFPTGIAVSPLPRAPTSKEQCKNAGWKNFPQFKNQGDCVSFVATHGKNPPG